MQIQAIGRHYGPLTTTATPAPLVNSGQPRQHTSQPIKCPMHPIKPLCAQITQKVEPELWRVISEYPHGTTCPGLVTQEESGDGRARRWKCSKCATRGAKAI